MAESAPKTTPKPSLKIEDGEGIPIATLAFVRGGVDIPGKPGANGVRCGEGVEREGDYELVYFPRMRHHRVAFKARNSARRTVYVHETQVASWEPLDVA